MAGHSSSGGRSGRKNSKNDVGKSLDGGLFSGVVVRDSFSITDTVRSEAGFTVYRTRFKLTVINQEGYHSTEEHEVLKRFSDFQSLSKQLEAVHALSTSTMRFPALVKAKYFERFKEAVIHQRKKSAEELLQFVSRYPHLSQSAVFLGFIAGSRLVSDNSSSQPPSNDHLPVTPNNLDLTSPHPQDLGNVTQSEPGILSPVVTIKEEEGLSVGFRSPNPATAEEPSDLSLDKATSKDKSLSSSPASILEPIKEGLAPVSDASILSAGSSVGSNVSLEILEVDSSFAGPQSEKKTSSSGSTSGSSDDESEGMEGLKETSSAGGSGGGSLTGSNVGMVSGGGGGVVGGASEMSWWRSAVAEADNVGDDLDALVNKVEETTPKTERSSLGRNMQGNLGRAFPPGSSGPSSRQSSRQSSRHSSHQGSPVQQRRVSPSAQRESAYAVQAGRLIAQALEFESQGDYEEAFDLMKAGVDVLLNGVQTDQNKDRREVVRRKTSEYLLYAENLQKKLSIMSSVKTDATPTASNQASVVSKESPVPAPAPARPHHLQDFRVKKVLGKVMLVDSKYTGQEYIIKVLHKSLKAMAAVPRGVSKATKNRAPSQCPYIVKLLHYYETPNHRIFLLLHYLGRGTLLEYVVSKREQWRKLKEAAMNPPPSSSLLSVKEPSSGNLPQERGAKEANLSEPVDHRQKDKSAEKEAGKDRHHGSNMEEGKEAERKDGDQLVMSDSSMDSDMEKMLTELSTIIPPSNLPPSESSISKRSDVSTGSRNSHQNDYEKGSEDEDSLDMLALMRKRLEESMLETCETQHQLDSDGKSLKIELSPADKNTSRSGSEEGKTDEEEDFEVINTTIRVLPPTPTVTKATLGNGKLEMTSFPLDPMKSLRMGSTEDVARNRSLELPDSSSSSSSSAGAGPTPGVEKVGLGRVGGEHAPFFTPSLLQHSDLKRVDDWSQRLEHSVKRWAAQIVLALEHLHNHGIICRDLHPGNVLINDSGEAVLTYFGKWDFVEGKENIVMARRFYMAPELSTLSEPTVAVDWWCLGTFLFELLTGTSLASCLPGGTHSHLPLPLPIPLSSEAKSFLTQLLQISPAERLGSGPAGVEEVKAHPFFATINWRKP